METEKFSAPGIKLTSTCSLSGVYLLSYISEYIFSEYSELLELVR